MCGVAIVRNPGPGPAPLLASGLLLLLLTGCRPAPPAATSASQTPQPPSPPPLEFRWLTAGEAKVAGGFLADSGNLATRRAFLAVYRKAAQEPARLREQSAVRALLRLWELNRVARVTGLSAGEVREAVGLAGHKRPLVATHQPGGQAPEGCRAVAPAALDRDARSLLSVARPDGGNYAQFVYGWLHYIVTVDDPGLLDPNLPLTCEGTVEPLSAAAFITLRDTITGEPRAGWQTAAALVHEAEHVRWYHQVAGRDPRLLLPLPDERNAYRGMFLFLQAAQRLAARRGPSSAAAAAAIAESMQLRRNVLREANRLLGYPEDDLSDRHDLAVSDEILRISPAQCSK